MPFTPGHAIMTAPTTTVPRRAKPAWRPRQGPAPRPPECSTRRVRRRTTRPMMREDPPAVAARVRSSAAVPVSIDRALTEQSHPAPPERQHRNAAVQPPLRRQPTIRWAASAQDRLQVTYARSALSCPDFRTDHAYASTLPTKIATTRGAVGLRVATSAERAALRDRRSRSTPNTLGSAQTRPHSRNGGISS